MNDTVSREEFEALKQEVQAIKQLFEGTTNGVSMTIGGHSLSFLNGLLVRYGGYLDGSRTSDGSVRAARSPFK